MDSSTQTDLTEVDWPSEIQRILLKEDEYHERFFGHIFDLRKFERVLQGITPKDLEKWRSLYLEIHYLPRIAMLPWQSFPGWKHKISQGFYELAAGQNGCCIMRRNEDGSIVPDENIHKLLGITVLIDTRLKNAKMLRDDKLMGRTIAWLRENKRIAAMPRQPITSRFGVSSDEWDKHIRPHFCKSWSLQLSQVRLERVIETNIIPQLYPHMPRSYDGKIETEVWCEEFFFNRKKVNDSLISDVQRMSGGNGLTWYSPVDRFDRWNQRAVRPLIILG